MIDPLERLARALSLGALLEVLRDLHGEYALLAHWTQGEFHHDVVVRLSAPGGLPGDVLVIATNCNGGVKEVLCLDALPTPDALWRRRCPRNVEFTGEPVTVLAECRTHHWFDPCDLLAEDARSELRPEHRRRQRGGGWCAR